jgi:hypothetical protein
VCLSDPSPINSFHQLIRLRGSKRYVEFSSVRTAHAPLIEEARSIDHRASRLEDWLTSRSSAELCCSRRVCSCAGEALEPESVSPAMFTARPRAVASISRCRTVLMFYCLGRLRQDGECEPCLRDGRLFPSPRAEGGHLTTVAKQFREARSQAGLPGQLVLLARVILSFGTAAYEATGNLAMVMKVMGQTDVRTAMRYQHPISDPVCAKPSTRGIYITVHVTTKSGYSEIGCK